MVRIAAGMIVSTLLMLSPASAQVDIFQGPWNAFAQPTAASSRGGYSARVIGGAPAGCGHLGRLYCGCASAKYVGLSGTQWNLASNWLRLPRAAPAPGMAAVRPGHVKIITAVHGNGKYSFYDPNSGGGQTRITTTGLNGYAVVNPRGGVSSNYASAARKTKHWHKRARHHRRR